MMTFKTLTAAAIASLVLGAASLTTTPATAGDHFSAGVAVTPYGPTAVFGYSNGPAYRPYRYAPAYRPVVRPVAPIVTYRAPVVTYRAPVVTYRAPVKPVAQKVATRSCSPILKKKRVFIAGKGWTETRVQVGRECKTVWR